MTKTTNFLDVFDYFRSLHLDSPDIIHELQTIKKLDDVVDNLNRNHSAKIERYSVFKFIEILEMIFDLIVKNDKILHSTKKSFQEEYEKLFPVKSEKEILEVLKQQSQIIRDEINKALQ